MYLLRLNDGGELGALILVRINGVLFISLYGVSPCIREVLPCLSQEVAVRCCHGILRAHYLGAERKALKIPSESIVWCLIDRYHESLTTPPIKTTLSNDLRKRDG